MPTASQPDISKFWDFLNADKYAVKTDIKIDSVSLDCVQCSLETAPDNLNANDVVQGGAIFTLADLAFAAHCNMENICGESQDISVGQSCSISFLKPARGERLIAKSSCLSKGRTMSVYRVSVEDNLGTPIAEFMGNAFRIIKST
jgi:acyl-CoA thioesterase